MSRIKQLSPISKHHARVFSYLLISLFLSIFCVLLVSIFINLEDINIMGGIVFMMYINWVTNVRFGWLENLIEGKKKYPRWACWFEPVHNNKW